MHYFLNRCVCNLPAPTSSTYLHSTGMMGELHLTFCRPIAHTRLHLIYLSISSKGTAYNGLGRCINVERQGKSKETRRTRTLIHVSLHNYDDDDGSWICRVQVAPCCGQEFVGNHIAHSTVAPCPTHTQQPTHNDGPVGLAARSVSMGRCRALLDCPRRSFLGGRLALPITDHSDVHLHSDLQHLGNQRRVLHRAATPLKNVPD